MTFHRQSKRKRTESEASEIGGLAPKILARFPRDLDCLHSGLAKRKDTFAAAAPFLIGSGHG